MSFQERVSFPIKAESTRSTDEEEAFLCSSLVKEKTLTTTPVLHNINHLDLTSNNLLKKFRDEMMLEIQRQNDKIHDLQDKNEELTKQLLFSNPFDTDRDAETIGLRSNILRSSSAVTRSTLNIDADGEQNFSLPKDTFSLMMVSNPFSGPWLIGLLVYVIQVALFIFLCVELFTKDKGGILAQFSVETSTMLSFAEFLVLITIFLLQSDLVEATRCLFVLEDRHVFHLTCGHYIVPDISSITSSSDWWKKKMCFTLPNVLKLSMAIITILASVCVTLQSASVLELLKDFSALMIVNEIDNHVFELFVENGLCGLEAKKKADEVSTRSVKVDVVYAPLAHPKSKSRNDRWCRKDSLLIFTSYILTLAMWIAIFVLQRNGTVEWATNYPGCKVPIKKLVGDGKCNGREYNTEECKWDGEDCVIPAYPKCHVDNPSWIGDGYCHNNDPYNTTECGRDGGDCIVPGYPDCHVDVPSDIGNGVCDRGDYNTEECGWDGGDCTKDSSYPGCFVDSIEFIGDGKCDGGYYYTGECDWDGGDCTDFNKNYPYCIVHEPFKVGDGVCQGLDYNTEECGWDGGDCIEFNKYPNCAVEEPLKFQDGQCDGGDLNTEECGWDGGDCIKFNQLYPLCKVHDPYRIGNDVCDREGDYNTEECGWDGGDCEMFKNYPNCAQIENPSLIGNGKCDGGNYNTEECGWDGGDCFLLEYPDCHVDEPEKIGDGTCHNWLLYNTAECGWEGGDCDEFNKYPNCRVKNPSLIGDKICDGGDYNTEECGWDGGDCIVDGYPDCHVKYTEKVGDGTCHNWIPINTKECGWDGGDCILRDYPDCHVYNLRLIGNGECNGAGGYNTAECGWDGGDCLVPRYPDCHVNNPFNVGDQICDSDHNTEECGWDGGDCLLPGYPHCHVNDPHLVGDGKCDGGVYNTTECGWDKGDCLQV